MCGRYLINAAPEDLRRAFEAEISQVRLELRPLFDIAPTQVVPIVRGRVEHGARELRIVRSADGGAEREAVAARWGLIPSWAKDGTIGSRLINGRAETIAR